MPRPPIYDDNQRNSKCCCYYTLRGRAGVLRRRHCANKLHISIAADLVQEADDLPKYYFNNKFDCVVWGACWHQSMEK